MFAGQMGCEVLNFLLKRMIKGERPPRELATAVAIPRLPVPLLAFFEYINRI